MGLKGEVPVRMKQDIPHTLGGYLTVTLLIACIAGLKAQIGIIGQGTVALRGMLAVENHLYLINPLQCEGRHMSGKLVLWRPGHPVNGRRQRMGSVGLNSNKKTC